MFEIKKELLICGSHHLTLPYDSPCSGNHGHNWKITIYCRAEDEYVDRNFGMVIDFKEIKKRVHGVLDHKCLNDVEGVGFVKRPDPALLNTTAENIARWVCNQVPHCYKVEVEETPDNVATYIIDN